MSRWMIDGSSRGRKGKDSSGHKDIYISYTVPYTIEPEGIPPSPQENPPINLINNEFDQERGDGGTGTDGKKEKKN